MTRPFSLSPDRAAAGRARHAGADALRARAAAAKAAAPFSAVAMALGLEPCDRVPGHAGAWCNCPACGGALTLGINAEDCGGRCRACLRTFDAISLIERARDVRFAEALTALEAMGGTRPVDAETGQLL